MSSERLGALAVADALVAARRAGRAVASVKSLRGISAGAHVLVYADGSTHGSLGAAQLDDAAIALANESLKSRAPALHETVTGEQLFADPQFVTDRLLIIGAGHIAVPLAWIGGTLGFEVTVLDDREEFATEERFPAEATVVRMDFAQPFAQVQPDERSYVVLVTRAHKYDFDCLRELLNRSELPRYIGMIGSRRRVRAAFHALFEGGVPPDRIAAVHAPLGLDIGAETPAEIAVSIAAELIMARSGAGSGAPLGDNERVLERFFSREVPEDQRHG